MNPQAEQLAQSWINDFFAANHELTWLAVEEERQLWLDSQTLLIGKVDARGLDGNGDPFFGEWKTKGARWAKRMEEVKQTWRMAPQALTYGVLLMHDADRFTVRWALKTNPPQTAFEWYSYNMSEMNHWHDQLLEIAHGIRRYRQRDSGEVRPWQTNLGACDRHGVKYRCPHFNGGCGVLDFTTPTGPPREPHTELERQLSPQSTNPPISDGRPLRNVGDLVVLSSSRVADWLECPEQYRRNWEGVGFHETSEALEIGSDFHSIIGTYLQGLVKHE
jgi:hypothetical protein